jgi:hypothetical protein
VFLCAAVIEEALLEARHAAVNRRLLRLLH